MLKKEQLEAMKVSELRELFNVNGISYYQHSKRMTKAEMIERYLIEVYGTNDEEIINAVDELVNEEEATKKVEAKKKYIEQAKIGTIVAFKLPSGKVISAAITKKSTSNRKFMVETKYGVEHKISFDDVIWVRTNKRWPKGIYQLFKKNTTEVIKYGKENDVN